MVLLGYGSNVFFEIPIYPVSIINMKRIAVLMTVHNRREKTLRCLECLYANTIPVGYTMEVYLTDDGCSDGTPEAVEKRFADVHIIKGDGNLYWNRGMWTAWNEAAKEDFDYYLWLNDDTFLYLLALNNLISESVLHDNKVIIVGATENSDKTTITYGGYKNRKRQKPQGKTVEVEYFNGNVALIPRYVYDILGNLDYRFRHSKGDFDYGLRAGKEGIRMIQLGEFVGICAPHESIGMWCNPNISFTDRIQALYKPNGMPPMEFFYFDRKHHGIKNAIIHYLSIHLRCLCPKLWMDS